VRGGDCSRGGAARHRGARRLRGQALVELLVASAALVPLVVGIVLVGRLQDVRTAVVQSARYAAFGQALGEASTADVQSEVRARFFGHPEHAPRAADRRDDRAGANPHWVDVLRPVPMIREPADVTVRLANRPPPGAAARAMSSTVAGVDRITALTGGTFGLERRGYVGAEVDVRLAALPSLARREARPLSLHARAAVLGRDWSAAGPAETAVRASALVPTSPLRRVRPVIAPLAWALSLLEPALRELCLAPVDPELVPFDRLGPPGSDDAGRWTAPCE
jgi:hypothetical protein